MSVCLCVCPKHREVSRILLVEGHIANFGLRWHNRLWKVVVLLKYEFAHHLFRHFPICDGFPSNIERNKFCKLPPGYWFHYWTASPQPVTYPGRCQHSLVYFSHIYLKSTAFSQNRPLGQVAASVVMYMFVPSAAFLASKGFNIKTVLTKGSHSTTKYVSV